MYVATLINNERIRSDFFYKISIFKAIGRKRPPITAKSYREYEKIHIIEMKQFCSFEFPYGNLFRKVMKS